MNLVKAVSVFLGLSLALIHQTSSPADALWGVGEKPTSKTESIPQRDFLPPVATINGSIQFEEPLKEDPLEPITLTAVDSPVLKINKGSLVLDNDLGIKASNQEYQTLLRSQKDLDAEDLKKLWEATVERNPVIRFSLEKLSTPPEWYTLGVCASSNLHLPQTN
ncbi:MAG: hypothetical protein K2X66_04780, partial [Cyanobacteria bacterium]|nr:hypothetical protein [Cyanobacteriota bacterium]